MDNLGQLNLLIDKASEIAGSDAKLGRLVGQSPVVISQMRHGKRSATPEDCALFAMVAGLDPAAEMARAVLRKHEGTKKGDLLYRALGKASLATGAVLGSAGAHASVIYGTVLNLLDTMCIAVQQSTRRCIRQRFC